MIWNEALDSRKKLKYFSIKSEILKNYYNLAVLCFNYSNLIGKNRNSIDKINETFIYCFNGLQSIKLIERIM